MIEWIVPLSFVLTGVVIVAVSIPLIRRRVGPNHLYGLRVPATFADDWVWYEANAKSGRDLAAFGVALCLLALALPWSGLSAHAYALGLAAFAAVGVLVCCVVGWRRANRLLAERRAAGLATDPG